MSVTRKDVEKVVAAIGRQIPSAKDEGYGPLIGEDDRQGWTIIWEEGPFQWTYLFPHGGIEEEFGTKLEDVSADLPAGIWAEAINHYSIGVRGDDW